MTRLYDAVMNRLNCCGCGVGIGCALVVLAPTLTALGIGTAMVLS